MNTPYGVIEIFTGEEVRFEGAPLSRRIVEYVRDQKLAARCIVSRGIAGCYENGEIATHGVEVLSFNMPVKIEVILPLAEVERLLPALHRMVIDGIVVVRETRMSSHRTHARMLPRQLRVRDAMTPDPVIAHPDTPVSEIVKIILHARFNGVPVVDDDRRPIGIITQGDLIQRAGLPIRKALLESFDSKHVDEFVARLSARKASEIMTRHLEVIRDDQPIQSAVELMLNRKLKRLPVIDGNGRLVGMFSRLDVFRAVHRETPAIATLQSHKVDVQHVRTAADIMEADTPKVHPDTPLDEVIRLIDTSDVQRVVVVDSNGIFLGMISDKILLRAFSEQRAGLWQYLIGKLPFKEIGKHRREWVTALKAQTARDVMNANVITVRDDSPIDEVIRLMAEKSIKRIPVLHASGLFVGMISRDDVLRMGMVG